MYRRSFVSPVDYFCDKPPARLGVGENDRIEQHGLDNYLASGEGHSAEAWEPSIIIQHSASINDYLSGDTGGSLYHKPQTVMSLAAIIQAIDRLIAK